VKKFIALFICILFAISLIACSADQTTDAEKETSSESTVAETTIEVKSKKVAGVVFQEDQFMKLLQLGYQNAAESAGYEFVPGNTNGDAAKEVEYLNTFTTQGIAGLAISPISEEASLEPLAKAAAEGLIIGLSNSNLGNPDWMLSCYTSDNYQLGQSTGEACLKFINEKLGGKANIGVLQFKSLLPEQSGQRYQGFVDALSGHDGIKIIADQDAWMQDKAITVASDMLTSNPDLNIIWAANEGGTVGATMAIKNAGLAEKVFAFGTDASEQTIGMIQAEDNILQAVTGQDPYQIGIKTMEAVIAKIEGKDFGDEGKTVIVPGVVLDRSKPDEVEAFRKDLLAKISG